MSLLPSYQPKYHPIQQETDDHDPKRQEADDYPKRQETNDPKRQQTEDPSICLGIIGIIVLLLVPLLIWFLIKLIIFETIISSSNNPKFHVDDVTLTQFKLSPINNTLYYNLEVNMTFRNPNSHVGIHYDKIKVTAMYHGQRLTTKRVQGFHVGHKKENNNVNAFFKGERVLVLYNGDERALYESESEDGVYEIDLKLGLEMRLSTLSWDTLPFESKVVCHLKVPLISFQDKQQVPFVKFERTHCAYTYYY